MTPTVAGTARRASATLGSTSPAFGGTATQMTTKKRAQGGAPLDLAGIAVTDLRRCRRLADAPGE